MQDQSNRQPLEVLGLTEPEQPESRLVEPPPVPRTIQDTGLNGRLLLNFILKFLYVPALQTVSEISNQIKLSQRIVESLLETLKEQRLVEITGTADNNPLILKYVLTSKGKERAIEASKQSAYMGPVPVPLATYQAQVEKQTVTNERIDAEQLSQSFSHLVLPEKVLRQLGPGINSGRAILLYGSGGNGKSSIAEALGRTFQQTIYIPYCIEVDGQIIRIFDPALHEEDFSEQDSESSEEDALYGRSVKFDPRWVRCRRPSVVTGGELTLKMLDLDFDVVSKYYEAPLQVKATGGVFIIDDFGRQQIQPHDLMNRWILPLEKRVDYLTLHTGKKFQVPFDEVVIFSTNIPPGVLMDPPSLRRIPYKLQIDPPTEEEYETIFRRVCKLHDLEFSQDLFSYLMDDFYKNNTLPLAGFHPKFIVEHVMAACKYEGVLPHFSRHLLKDALQNLVVNEPTEREKHRAALGPDGLGNPGLNEPGPVGFGS
jgi:predicted ATPase with chaperone activity